MTIDKSKIEPVPSDLTFQTDYELRNLHDRIALNGKHSKNLSYDIYGPRITSPVNISSSFPVKQPID